MILKNCNKCWCKISERLYEINNWICNTCKSIPQEIKLKEVKVVEDKPKQVETSEEFYKWLPLYSSYYLNKKKNINLNSIKNEIVCIKYKDKYILKEDIIKQFKESLS